MRQQYLLYAFLLCSACGDNTFQTSPGDDANVARDAGVRIDAPSHPCDYQGFAPRQASAERDSNTGFLLYTAMSGQFPAAQVMNFDLYFGLGAKDQAHLYTFAAENLKTCHTCSTLRRDCRKSNCANGTAFLVQSGEADIKSTKTTLRAKFKNLVFAEVNISLSGQSTLVPNGKTWCLDQYEISLPIQEIPSK